MREPLNRFPKRPSGPEQTRRTLDECQRMLANPRLSEEMRRGLEQRIAQLRAEIDAANAARHVSDEVLKADNPGGTTRSPRR